MPSSRTPLSYAVAATVAAGAACGSATSPTGTGSTGAPVPRRIVVLGDSLAVSPNRSQNFVSELQARLYSTPPGWTLTNQGVIRDTTADGVRRMDSALMSETGILV